MPFNRQAKSWRKSWLIAVLASACVLAATDLPAQIYDDVDLGKWRNPGELFSRHKYVTQEFLDEFIAGGYDLSRFAGKYRDRLEKTLEPNRASQSGDLGFQVQLAAAYLWTDQTPKALEVLEPLGQRAPADLAPHTLDILYNLAQAYEQAGLYAKALEAARRAEAIRGMPNPLHEEVRLSRLEYRKRAESDPEWAAENLAEPQFTFAWRQKRLPPVSFNTFNPPKGIDNELRKFIYSIRAAPDNADSWLAMAMVAEKRSTPKTLLTAYRLYERAIDLGHPMADKVKVHKKSLEPYLPAGYSFVGSLWIAIQRSSIVLGIGFILVFASRFMGKKSWGGIERLRARLAARRERKWRADKWQDHHIDSLQRELDDRLEEKD